MVTPQKVVVIAHGTSGYVSDEAATNMEESIAASLRQKKPDWEVRIVKPEELDRIAAVVHVAIFNSRSQIERARDFKRAHASVNVIVMTGLVPTDEILFFDKTWGPEVLMEMI